MKEKQNRESEYKVLRQSNIESLRATEMSQLAKEMSHEHEKLNADPQPANEKPGVMTAMLVPGGVGCTQANL